MRQALCLASEGGKERGREEGRRGGRKVGREGGGEETYRDRVVPITFTGEVGLPRGHERHWRKILENNVGFHRRHGTEGGGKERMRT